MVLIIAAEVWLGMLRGAVPGLYLVGRIAVPIGVASVAASSRHSGMEDLEQSAAVGLRRAEVAHLVTAVMVSAGLAWLAATLVVAPAAGAVTLRAVFLTAGLAVIAGRLFGWLLSWTLPMATVVPLTIAGIAPEPPWWDWAGAPAGSGGTWLLAGVSIILGAATVGCTSWRLHAALRAAARLRHRSAGKDSPEPARHGRIRRRAGRENAT